MPVPPKPSTPFGVELVEAMRARGVTVKALAAALGVSTMVVKEWRSGVVPNIPRAVMIADALLCPSLVDRARDSRTRRCVCGALFVDAGVGKPRSHCTTRCYHRHYRRAKRRYDAGLALAQLAEHRKAVARHCFGCEPEGVCRDAGCALRPVSPLPLARVRVA